MNLYLAKMVKKKKFGLSLFYHWKCQYVFSDFGYFFQTYLFIPKLILPVERGIVDDVVKQY